MSRAVAISPRTEAPERRSKPRILTLVAYYLPGYQSGGPVRTVANMVDHLGDEFEFWIVTADRDALDKEPYPDVQIDAWNRVGKAQVFYASPATQSLKGLARLIRETPHDVLYLNSFLSPAFTLRPLLARRLKLIPRRPVVIAPRGEFSEGAFALKRYKKQVYKTAFSALGVFGGLTWQASSDHELEDIRRALGSTAERIVVAPDLPARWDPALNHHESRPRKPGDPLRVCFLSRISPMKNLDFALRVLGSLRCPVEFNIFGPVRDQAYWAKCKTLLAEMPKHVQVHVNGDVEHSQVSAILAQQDLFFLPTRGENYGHAIAEALAVGTPVLIANTTPWRQLQEKGVGWDLSLDEEGKFVAAIEHASRLGTAEFQAWRQRVREYAQASLTEPALIQANRRLFLSALTKGI